MKVLELRGLKSLRAVNAYHMLLVGLKMLPMYMKESYEEFFDRISRMTEADQEKIFREAANLIPVEDDELKALVCFACDRNGVPYGPENIKNLGPGELIDIIVAVCMEIGRMKIDLVSESQKKNSETVAST